MILHPYHVTLFSKTCQNFFLFIGFPQDLSKSVDYKYDIRFMTSNFITTTLHDVLDKNRYKHNLS